MHLFDKGWNELRETIFANQKRLGAERENMGKLDDTLIIYIAGDNGNSAERSLTGTPNEVASLQGVHVPVEEQLKYFYDAWGSEKTYPHMVVSWTWAFDTQIRRPRSRHACFQ